jgi:hypothetical protein
MMNVKPYIMSTHPEYDKLVAQGALFTDPNTAASAVARLWSAGGVRTLKSNYLSYTKII